MRSLLMCCLPLLVAVVFYSTVTSGQDFHYDCNREDQGCQNSGTCNTTTGDCDCAANFIGFRCQLDGDTVTVDPAVCSVTCQNGGTCYNDGTSDLCLCTADWTGDQCETPRVDFTCTGDNVDITFSPITPFNGNVFVGSDSANTTCALTVDGSGNYVGDFPLDMTCDAMVETDANGDTTYIWNVNIQYLTFVEDPYSLALNVSCFHSANTTRESTGGISNTGGRPQTAPPITQDYQPARLELRQFPDFTSQVGDRVVIRQPIYLFNYLSDTSFFKAIQVRSCVLSDSEISRTIIEDGCAVDALDSLFLVENEAVDTPRGVRHLFRVFRLRRASRTLTFTCEVRMCTSETDPACTLQDCSATSSGRRRRRRDASRRSSVGVGVLDEEEQVSTVSVTITDPFEEAKEGDKDGFEELNTENCADEPVIKTTLIAMGVVSCLLLVAVVVLITCLIKHKTSGGSDKSSTIDEVLTDGSSWFRIPRVRTNH